MTCRYTVTTTPEMNAAIADFALGCRAMGASRALYAAAKRAIPIIRAEVDRILADNCALDALYQPRIDTMPTSMIAHLHERLETLAALVSVVAAVERP